MYVINVVKDVVELKLSNTNISIKRGTKKLLDDLGTRKDSYDDIIRRLIKENKELNSLIPKESVNINKLRIGFMDRKESSIMLSKEKIIFTYNVPQKPLKYFRFNIIYKKVLSNNDKKLMLKNYADSLHMARSYLCIYEKLIRTYIDPLFKMSKKHVLDLEWWKRKLLNLGFSHKTYKEDIENKIMEFGLLP